MKALPTLFIILMSASSTFAQDKPAYVLFNSKGKKVRYQKLVKESASHDIVMFGEQHNNPISHWLQLALVKDLVRKTSLILGAEMIETDNQEAMNRYLTGEIDYEGLDSLARLWPNYETDYAPVVEVAKEEGLPFIGTNIPRTYANMVYRDGGFEALDNLPEEEKAWIAPLPILFDPELPQYVNILTMMGDHGTPELVKAQAIKDATMAHFILTNLKEGSTFLHLNGAYHSDFHEGIVWYLQQLDPSLSVLTITTVEQEDLSSLKEEHVGKADFIIVVDAGMTKTY